MSSGGLDGAFFVVQCKAVDNRRARVIQTQQFDFVAAAAQTKDDFINRRHRRAIPQMRVCQINLDVFDAFLKVE